MAQCECGCGETASDLERGIQWQGAASHLVIRLSPHAQNEEPKQ